jgi:anthranilate synthase component 1
LDVPGVAPFVGGAVGYLGYDMVRFYESIPNENPDDLQFPESLFIFPEEVIVFDHVAGETHLIVYADTHENGRLDYMEQYVLACNRTASQTARNLVFSSPSRDTAPMSSRTSEPQFTEAVRRAKEHIHAGEIFQVVLSRRFDFTLQGSPLDLYKKLRATNPSPYMYLLNFAELQVLGSSPEMLVKLEGRRVVTRPLAGTRPRGSTPNEDIATEKDLLADEKERAEHVMLVDLARNDLGRVCKYGTVRTTEFLDIERYSRVIHLVSHVVGELAEGLDAFDVLRATFPAGTVSGAPKVRSMEIIDELETARRGVYAGAIGYFSVRGDMDMCIAIRTIVVHNRRGFIQAGAGIVADSEPDREFAETLAKASGLIRAVNAEKGAA